MNEHHLQFTHVFCQTDDLSDFCICICCSTPLCCAIFVSHSVSVNVNGCIHMDEDHGCLLDCFSGPVIRIRYSISNYFVEFLYHVNDIN